MRLGYLALHAGLALIVVGFHVACGSSQAPASAPTSSSASSSNNDKPKETGEVATGNTLTEFQKHRLLGHYSTSDGASGFILDRTQTPWKAKLDGVPKVVTLKESNQPRRGVKEYTSDDKSVWVRVGEEGDVELFQGPKQHEGVRVHRDADADQLK